MNLKYQIERSVNFKGLLFRFYNEGVIFHITLEESVLHKKPIY